MRITQGIAERVAATRIEDLPADAIDYSSTLAMSAETARRFGIDTTNAKGATAVTANGSIATSSVVVPQVDVAGINLNDVAVSVGISGEMLIGMSFLRRLDMTMNGSVLTLRKP